MEEEGAHSKTPGRRPLDICYIFTLTLRCQNPCDYSKCNKGISSKNHYTGYYDLIRVYILGDKLLDSNLENSAIHAIVENRLRLM